MKQIEDMQNHKTFFSSHFKVILERIKSQLDLVITCTVFFFLLTNKYNVAMTTSRRSTLNYASFMFTRELVVQLLVCLPWLNVLSCCNTLWAGFRIFVILILNTRC